ncbi:alpha/beta hydrolase fold domain-containing protein [Amycolatopsis jiangsuensis]|uniref:Acetyl esterase/lipase/L-ascorbate metabolism protein UlaG (Beta-lactamase superfamily) n=1 Tax=Amycolatopsis jiangsuensis TaxID=1181879 RepID=A0A840IQ29_9PSEU|nr:alpha/beta hydrolase fold domain-containing protein [Amycolatopsis jiangsuensis]MBB4683659.1 acetyl esterase/lipase/L-ascorbate metabolism protein UlaG (beta-lactamase superfamily) [Amycolatopsis jiangsuensis]
MHATHHPLSESDALRMAKVRASAQGAVDTGEVLVSIAAGEDTSPTIATGPFRTGSLTGEWVAAPGTAVDGVVLYLHGRRFQFEEPADVLAGKLSAATGWPVLMPRYRLAPAHPHPAALEDALDAYRALLEQGFPAGRIVLVGHSAGATLALQALLRLRAAGAPLPAAAVTVSPITDFTFSGASIAIGDDDVVTNQELYQVRGALLGDADPAGAVSPLSGVCPDLPPLMMACGSVERLLDDTVRFAERAVAAGTEVTLELYDGMPHGFPVLGTDAASLLLNRIAEFTTEHLARRPADAVRAPLTIRRVGWASYVVTTERGTRILVDPYLSGSEGIHHGLPESPIRPAELTDVDVVVVTHAGFDHRGQALEIVTSGHAVLVCGTALGASARAAGVPGERIAVTVSGVEVRHRDVTLRSLPARHESSMSAEGAFVADQPQSFLLTTAEGARVFCGGDTSLSQDLRTWGELYRPETAVLGIGGIWLGATRVVELPPADAAVAARWLGVSTVLPVHHVPGDAMPAQLAANLADDPIEVVPLAFGESWTAAGTGRPVRRT